MVHHGNDVIAVQDVKRLLGFAGDHLQVGFPHLTADETEPRCPQWPEPAEEPYLINKNFQKYGTLSAEAIAEGQLPADNLLISVEGGGSGNVFFINENSSTQWDLTGENAETCELVGDFYMPSQS